MKVQANTLLSIFTMGVISFLVVFSSVSNFKFNNHSKNWLNHDYGKNLLSSTEEYSVFMTEGGDNQVFSSLYFTYAEKLRQDLFPYDQKGNIFKRIYGDLRYVTTDVFEQRNTIVDRGLFTGQEPFYTDIRSLRPPYLVPYPLGKPATYLTWQRSNQSLLGDFYYKNYGIMYKVQEIPYAIVDNLEIFQTANTTSLMAYVQQKLGREITLTEFNTWANNMVAEGYIERTGNNFRYIKSYPKPFKKDPSESFIKRWDDIPNLPYYDYLSREIVISFVYEELSLLGNKIDDLQQVLNTSSSISAEKRQEIENQIEGYWTRIQKNIETVKTVGYDSAPTLYNVGIFYLSAKERFSFVTNDMLPQAIELWELSLASSPYGWSTYNILLWGYLRQSFADPSKSMVYLDSFDQVRTKMIANMGHWKSMKTNITNAAPYRQVAQMLMLRDQFDSMVANLDTQKVSINEMANGTRDLDLAILRDYFTKIINQLTFIDNTPKVDEFFQTWIQLYNRYKTNRDFFYWHLSLVGELTAYSNFIDGEIFDITIADARNYLPRAGEITQMDLQYFIFAFRIALVTGNTNLISEYKALLLMRAQELLPPDQFNSIKAQIDQLG